MITARFRKLTPVRALIALGLTAVSAVSLEAQRREAPRQRIMITTLASADRQLGVQAAEALRNRISRDAGERGVYVVPKADIENALTASGYPPDEPLAPHDARALAQQVRAEEYVEGTVTRAGTGIRLETRLVLQRDNSVTQTIPVAEASRLDQAAGTVSREILEARRQVEHHNSCAGALRAQDVPRAIAAAERGLQQHPKYNNMIKICLARAYVTRDSPAEGQSVVSPATLQLVEQVLQSDPRNIPALQFAAVGYKAAADRLAESDTSQARQFEDRYIQTLTSLVAADPTDLRLQEQVVNELAASGRANVAVPIILDALQANPGDPRMLRTAWLVLLAAREFERAIGIGEELVRFDTAAATADYFRRVAIAYTQLQRRTEAIQALERGIARFPNDAMLLGLLGQNLVQAAQVDRGIEILRRAVQAAPNNPEVRGQLIQALMSVNRFDEAAAEITSAAAAGVNRTLLAQLALKVGNDAYRAAQTSRARADVDRAIRFLTLSQSVEANLDAQFLLGASQFSLGDMATREAQAGRSCTSAQLAQQSFASARTNITAAQSRFPEPARQLLDAIGQFTTPVSQMVRAYCR